MLQVKSPLIFLASIGFSLLLGCSEAEQDLSAVVQSDSAEVAVLRDQLAALKIKAQRIADSNDIKRLQRAYGYYVDEALWDEVVDLFSEDATLELARDGVYRGKERIREYLYRLGGGQQGLSPGQLNEHYQLMPVVTLAEDGMTAQGRWRAIIMGGQYGESALWGEGPYENEYVKEDGVWKISKLHWYQTIMVPYEGGWAANADATGGVYVSGDYPPDEPPTSDYGSWPETFLPPFHFPNPVGTYIPQEAIEGEQ
ncbi:nuclear transport factor 2 family protein [Gammaproteobacteria bacterium]|nr:nuclear transport factor 2 family protein [Gammaproteobacteria bacterium]